MISGIGLALKLIGRYLEEVRGVVEALQEKFKRDDLLRAVNSRHIPRKGSLDQSLVYSFHGVGCSARRHGLEVDFDFGPNDRHDGFDAWRLHLFAAGLPEFAGFADLSEMEKAIESLLEHELIECPNWQPSPHLLYLTELGRKKMERAMVDAGVQ